jgi:hypothetical protein
MYWLDARGLGVYHYQFSRAEIYARILGGVPRQCDPNAPRRSLENHGSQSGGQGRVMAAHLQVLRGRRYTSVDASVMATRSSVHATWKGHRLLALL